MHYFHGMHDEHAANLKDLMSADPMTIEAHAAIIRKRVESRRLVEDARAEAQQRQLELS
jgi:hypothetical protein